MREVIKKSISLQNRFATKEIEAILNKKNPDVQMCESLSELWDFSVFNLANSRLISTFNEEKQNELRESLCRYRLRESLNIEKAGMNFAAKMSLLSNSIDEQQLYSHFAKEEATHFNMLDNFLDKSETFEPDQFINFLNELIIHGERMPLIFIIQVVLEGWGIAHYQELARSCQNSMGKEIFDSILKDEGAHHGSGLSLFDESRLSDKDFDFIVGMMRDFMGMVTCGPQMVLGLVKEMNHGLTTNQERMFLKEIDAKTDTQRKVDYIRALMEKAGAFRVIEKLDSYDSFLVK